MIQKEKETQKEILLQLGFHAGYNHELEIAMWRACFQQHREDMISLKEYIEEELQYHKLLNRVIMTGEISGLYNRLPQLKENLQELKEIIKKYS